MSLSMPAWRAKRAWRALALAPCLSVLACGPVEESAWISAVLTQGEAMQASYVVMASSDGELEVEWTIEIDNAGASCPVAVYTWDELGPGPAQLPTLGPGETWPEEWFGGELVIEEVVGAGETLELGPTPVGQQRGRAVEGLITLATCHDSNLAAVLAIDASADLGTRTLAEALVIELWRSS